MDSTTHAGAPAPPEGNPEDSQATLLIDHPESHIRRAGDALAAVVSLLGIALVLVLAVFGQGTTVGVITDVQGVVGGAIRQLLVVPIAFLSGLVLVVIPVWVLTTAMVRRQWRNIAQSAAAMAAAGLLSLLAVHLLILLGPNDPIIEGLAVNTRGLLVPVLAPLVAAIAALLSADGRSSTSRPVRWSWAALITVLALAVIQGEQTLPSAIVSLLLGRAIGLTVRFILGAQSHRATGLVLLRGIRRTGIAPSQVVRQGSSQPVEAWLATSDAPLGYRTAATIAPGVLVPASNQTPSQLTPVDPETTYRWYAAQCGEKRYDVAVMDADRQVVGFLENLWESLRIRGLNRRVTVTLREATEHTVLMSYAAAQAGVRTPALVGVAEAGDSIVLTFEHRSGLRPLAELTSEEITDPVADEVWTAVGVAHTAGIAHREITASHVLVDPVGKVWLASWDVGEIASSELLRQIDLAHTLTMLAIRIGPERAIASARRMLSEEALTAVLPLLQRVVLPKETRKLIRPQPKLMTALRSSIATYVPDGAEVPDVPLQRISFRRLLAVSLVFAVAFVLFGTFKWSEVLRAFAQAEAIWLVFAFLAGITTFIGAAIGLVAFTPERLPYRRTLLVEAAGSVISLVAPAGVGPAAVELRYLTKAKIEAKLALATVTFTQVMRTLSTIALLVLITIFAGTGDSDFAVALPSGLLIGVILVLLAGTGTAMAVPQVRTYLVGKFGPFRRHIWPRVMWVLSNPSRLLLGIAGNVLQTVAFVAAFGFTLLAFGHPLPVGTLFLTYLASASAGSLVPSPAGIGPVEVALTSGLTIAGVPASLAISAVLVFRVLTLWGRLPLGALALRYLSKHDVL